MAVYGLDLMSEESVKLHRILLLRRSTSKCKKLVILKLLVDSEKQFRIADFRQ
jgi:hypothetical protein